MATRHSRPDRTLEVGRFYSQSFVQPFWDEFILGTSWLDSQTALFGDEISGHSDTLYIPNLGDDDA